MNHQPIPFLDLVTPHLELEDELVQVFRDSLRSAAFIGGLQLEQFEHEFAEFCGTPHCVGVGSGTDALRFAFIAAGVRPGETVLTVPNTFIATTEAISRPAPALTSLTLIQQTYTLDPAKLRVHRDRVCSTNHRQDSGFSLSPTRSGGRDHCCRCPCICMARWLTWIQSSTLSRAQFIGNRGRLSGAGAEYILAKEQRWRTAGSMGHAAAFSFYPGKNLGACGEAGAMTTATTGCAKCRMLRDHGQSKKYFHDIEGYNGRLDAIQAGFLRVKLRHLGRWNDERREHAAFYNELFEVHPAHSSRRWFRRGPSLSITYMSFRLLIGRRFSESCRVRKFGTGIHYPIPLHLQNAYAHLGVRRRQISCRGRAGVANSVAADVSESDAGGTAPHCGERA